MIVILSFSWFPHTRTNGNLMAEASWRKLMRFVLLNSQQAAQERLCGGVHHETQNPITLEKLGADNHS
jgi:hypothetical protein